MVYKPSGGVSLGVTTATGIDASAIEMGTAADRTVTDVTAMAIVAASN